MGTKNNPGAFDCYAKADPDEPLFTLLARDPLFSNMVRLWAALRAGDLANAALEFAFCTKAATIMRPRPGDFAKIAEAKECAKAGVAWRANQHKRATTPARAKERGDG